MAATVLTITNGVPSAAAQLSAAALAAIVTGTFPVGAAFELRVSDDNVNYAPLSRAGFMGLFGTRAEAGGVALSADTWAKLVNVTPGITTGFSVRVALQ